MLGKVKRWLGIEGIKIELEVPEYFVLTGGILDGNVKISSMTDQRLQSIQLKLIEKYKRGRKGQKLIDEYTLGEVSIPHEADIQAGEVLYLSFAMPFVPLKSEMDMLQEKNILVRGVVSAAKFLKGVDSEYRLEARAQVKGTALHPFATKVLKAE